MTPIIACQILVAFGVAEQVQHNLDHLTNALLPDSANALLPDSASALLPDSTNALLPDSANGADTQNR